MKNKSRGIQLITIFTVIIMFICIILLIWQFTTLYNLQKRQDSLQIQKEYLDQTLFNYESMNTYYSNNRTEYLEDYARESLNWAKPNENWYTN